MPDPDRPGLVFPVVWTVDQGLALFGRVCPAPMLDDPLMLDAPTEGGCGIDAHQFSLRLLDLANATWSEIELDVPLLSGQELAVLGASNSSVLVRGGDRDDEEIPALFVLDLDTGMVSDLGVAPKDVGSIWCGAAGRFLGTTSPGLTETGDVQPLEALVVRAGEISTISLGEQSLLPIGCSDGAMLAIEPSGSTLLRITMHDDGVESALVPLPDRLDAPAHRRIDVGRRQPNQTPLLWESEAGSFQLWEFDGEGWSKVGSPQPGSDPAMLAGVRNGQVFAFAISDSVTKLVEI